MASAWCGDDDCPLVFRDRRIQQHLQKTVKENVSITAGIFLARVLEVLTTEFLIVVAAQMKERGGINIEPKDITTALIDDFEFLKLAEHAVIPQRARPPTKLNIHPELLHSKSRLRMSVKKRRELAREDEARFERMQARRRAGQTASFFDEDEDEEDEPSSNGSALSGSDLDEYDMRCELGSDMDIDERPKRSEKPRNTSRRRATSWKADKGHEEYDSDSSTESDELPDIPTPARFRSSKLSQGPARKKRKSKRTFVSAMSDESAPDTDDEDGVQDNDESSSATFSSYLRVLRDKKPTKGRIALSRSTTSKRLQEDLDDVADSDDAIHINGPSAKETSPDDGFYDLETQTDNGLDSDVEMASDLPTPPMTPPRLSSRRGPVFLPPTPPTIARVGRRSSRTQGDERQADEPDLDLEFDSSASSGAPSPPRTSSSKHFNDHYNTAATPSEIPSTPGSGLGGDLSESEEMGGLDDVEGHDDGDGDEDCGDSDVDMDADLDFLETWLKRRPTTRDRSGTIEASSDPAREQASPTSALTDSRKGQAEASPSGTGGERVTSWQSPSKQERGGNEQTLLEEGLGEGSFGTEEQQQPQEAESSQQAEKQEVSHTRVPEDPLQRKSPIMPLGADVPNISGLHETRTVNDELAENQEARPADSPEDYPSPKEPKPEPIDLTLKDLEILQLPKSGRKGRLAAGTQADPICLDDDEDDGDADEEDDFQIQQVVRTTTTASRVGQQQQQNQHQASAEEGGKLDSQESDDLYDAHALEERAEEPIYIEDTQQADTTQ